MQTTQTFTLHSVTAAMKAKKLLSDRNIPVTVIKRVSENGGGCQYGISLPVSRSAEGVSLLSANGLRAVPLDG
jgi:hypothetical protein